MRYYIDIQKNTQKKPQNTNTRPQSRGYIILRDFGSQGSKQHMVHNQLLSQYYRTQFQLTLYTKQRDGSDTSDQCNALTRVQYAACRLQYFRTLCFKGTLRDKAPGENI